MTDRIARALFIGEKLLSEHAEYMHHVVKHFKGECYPEGEEYFANWLESPDGLKAVRDALIALGATISMRITRSFIEFDIMEICDCHHMAETEHDAILSATEAFLRDE